MKKEYLDIITALYHVHQLELQTVSKHIKELDEADNAEDTFRNKLSGELLQQFDELVFLRTAIHALDLSDTFTDGFILGARLMLGILS